MSDPRPGNGVVYYLMGVLFLLVMTVNAASDSGPVLVWLGLGLAFLALGLASQYRRA